MSSLKELAEQLKKEPKLTKAKIENIKRDWAKKHNLGRIPLNSEIQKYAPELDILKTKPVRTLSGVSVIAVMTAPLPCPGKCIYCPSSDIAPKSYTGHEPSAMRSRLNDFDPYKTVKNRLKQLKETGHTTEKNEVIIQGGTFPALPKEYQYNFVKRIYDAFNDKESSDLKEAQKINEIAKHRVIGLTIETRPDWIDTNQFLEFGATRVELGVQTTSDEILKKIKRGHDIKTTIKAFRELKNAAFKINAHMMPGLPGSTFESDVKMFRELFTNPDFKPDMIKIYPTLVMEGTELYDLWKLGKYKPIDEQYMIDLLAEVYKMVPPWIRIMRIQRDIPKTFIKAGPTKSNLRELAENALKYKNIQPKEIRFREIGHTYIRTKKLPEKIEIKTLEYEASEGKEIFISAEDVKNNILIGFARLRFPNNSNLALLRELHVYGEQTPIGEKGNIQHKGYGSKLMEKAEQISKSNNKSKISVIAGVGVRQYYIKKLDYKQDGYYVSKEL
jgi:elongator complex protein 3